MKIKTAVVNGAEISAEAVEFELERLVRFYSAHGASAEEVRGCLGLLREKALEQAIGARLLLDRSAELDIPVTAADVDAEVERVVAQIGGREAYLAALKAQGVSEEGFRRELEKGAKVNKLVEQACASVAEPTDAEIAAFFESRRDAYAKENRTLVDAHDEIRDLLRHDARGKAMDAFVAELKASAKIEYKTVEAPHHEHGCSCGCGHHH